MSAHLGRKKSRLGVLPVRGADGTLYGSKFERDHHQDLLLAEKAGEIFNVRHHVTFEFEINGRALVQRSPGYPNGRKVRYIADFVFGRRAEALGMEHVVVQDTKGHMTELSALKIGLMEAVHGIRVEIVRRPTRRSRRRR